MRVAELIAKLANAGAAVIAFDIVFAEPDRTSPKNVASIWASLQDIDGIKPQLEQLADHDAVLADVIGQTTVVTGYSLTKEGPGEVVLTNANTYSGNTTVNTGDLNVQNVKALGTGSSWRSPRKCKGNRMSL